MIVQWGAERAVVGRTIVRSSPYRVYMLPATLVGCLTLAALPASAQQSTSTLRNDRSTAVQDHLKAIAASRVKAEEELKALETRETDLRQRVAGLKSERDTLRAPDRIRKREKSVRCGRGPTEQRACSTLQTQC